MYMVYLLSINNTQHNNIVSRHHYAECSILLSVMLSVIMLNVIMLSAMGPRPCWWIILSCQFPSQNKSPIGSGWIIGNTVIGLANFLSGVHPMYMVDSFSINDTQHNNTVLRHHYAECSILLSVLLSVIMLNVVMLSAMGPRRFRWIILSDLFPWQNKSLIGSGWIKGNIFIRLANFLLSGVHPTYMVDSFSKDDTQQNNTVFTCHYAVCSILLSVLLWVIILNVIMLNAMGTRLWQ